MLLLIRKFTPRSQLIASINLRSPTFEKMKKVSLYLMTALYIVTGLNHFVHPGSYTKIMPHWLPWHYQLVYISGACEIAFALLLLFPLTRRLGLWCIILLLIAVFPANIQMMLNYSAENNKYLWVSIIRLPLQLFLILWAYSLLRTPDKDIVK